MSELIVATQWEACRINSLNDGEEWSIERPTENLEFPADRTITRACLDFELYEALRIPTGAVALEDVLEFKSRRFPELCALRDTMDDLLNSIFVNQSLPTGKIKAIQRLEKNLSDLNKVMSETQFETVWRSLRSIATAPCLALAASANFIPEYSAPLTAAAIGGSVLSFAVKEWQVGIELPADLKPFAYLASASRELQ